MAAILKVGLGVCSGSEASFEEAQLFIVGQALFSKGSGFENCAGFFFL